MPPRVVIAAIALFWLASVGWFALREWWPWLRADTPPPFTVELADEAAPTMAHWAILRNNQKIGSAVTRMTMQKNDIVELSSSVENLELPAGLLTIRVPKLTTIQRVTRDGQLLSLFSRIQLEVGGLGDKFTFTGTIQGDVRNGQLYATSKLEGPLAPPGEQQLDPIALPSGSMLNPLQPVARLRVFPGQRWKITHIDPLGEATRAAGRKMLGTLPGAPTINLGGGTPVVVLAEVASETRLLDHAGRQVECHLVEYRSDTFTGRTWAKADDGTVLRQEISGMGEKLVLVRED